MTTAALAETGQVGFARLMRWLDGLRRVSVLYLGQARTARFALIDLEPPPTIMKEAEQTEADVYMSEKHTRTLTSTLLKPPSDSETGNGERFAV